MNVVAICNLALSYIGHGRLITAITPPDGSVEADYFSRFYDHVRDALLESYPWRFATRRAPLPELANNELSGQWAYAYSLPADCIRPLAVYPKESTDDQQEVNFVTEMASTGTVALYTNMQDAVLKYIARVTDTTRYPPLFVAALARRLAYVVAGPLTQKRSLVDEQLKLFLQDYAAAMRADAQAQQNTKLHPFGADNVPSSLKARWS